MSDDSAETHFDGYTIMDGQLISDRVQRIVMAIHDYEPNIRVDWIPDRQAKAQNVNQFQIVYAPVGEPEFILFFVKDENEFDERVLQRIIVNDQRNGEVTWDEYSAAEATKKLIEKQVYLDMLEEAHEMAAAVLRSSKDTYKINDQLIFKQGLPFSAHRIKNDRKHFS